MLKTQLFYFALCSSKSHGKHIDSNSLFSVLWWFYRTASSLSPSSSPHTFELVLPGTLFKTLSIDSQFISEVQFINQPFLFVPHLLFILHLYSQRKGRFCVLKLILSMEFDWCCSTMERL